MSGFDTPLSVELPSSSGNGVSGGLGIFERLCLRTGKVRQSMRLALKGAGWRKSLQYLCNLIA